MKHCAGVLLTRCTIVSSARYLAISIVLAGVLPLLRRTWGIHLGKQPTAHSPQPTARVLPFSLFLLVDGAAAVVLKLEMFHDLSAALTRSVWPTCNIHAHCLQYTFITIPLLLTMRHVLCTLPDFSCAVVVVFGQPTLQPYFRPKLLATLFSLPMRLECRWQARSWGGS